MNNGVGGCCEGYGNDSSSSSTAQNMGWSSGNTSNIMGWAGSNGNTSSNSHGWVDEKTGSSGSSSGGVGAAAGQAVSTAVDMVAEAAKAEVKALANCFNPVGMAMAGEILVDPRITLAQQHADNHTDKATAFQATLDWVKMLLPPNPPQIPQRSSYSCPDRCPIPAPGLYGCPSVTVLKYIIKLAENGPITVNDFCGGCHDCNSPHYAGDAVDLKKDMIRTSEFWVECQKMGGWFFDEGESLHCDFRAKKN
ncbi:hypothetical protein DPMN_148258 [Dreissena polymorpha]|uniref:Uncharacterized protein n=2 Tax=Dreissena polymorpha TaxID=45954 RepID=A0A9D4J1C7_DREPO|nr:hypothetical protein DPMN_148258 [Dreissena polymorpha]